MMYLKLIAPSVLAVIFSGPLFSAEPMSADSVRSLLTNNTIHCKNFNKNKEFTTYFRDDGSATKLTREGETISGKWRVNDAGEHCLDWGEGECCNPVFDNGNGTYMKTDEGKPKTEFTVTTGNPEKL